MKKVLSEEIALFAICASFFATEVEAGTLLDKSDQIVLVRAKETLAKVGFYEKNNKSHWLEKWQTSGYIGRNGLTTDKHEGDGKTPIGVYDLGLAFGVEKNPGTKIPYKELDEKDVWVDDINSKYYNRYVRSDIADKDWISEEHLCNYKESYTYAIVIEYNTQPIVRGAGSAVFLHVETKEPTAGCVSIPKKYMKKFLQLLKPGAKIIITRY